MKFLYLLAGLFILTSSQSRLSDDSFERLKKGNVRFVSGKVIHSHEDAVRRKETKEGQDPFVAILACSDSRVPVELVFDQGIGDIFIVRIAGNISEKIQTASIEYAVDSLNVPLVLVLGHQNCGAVSAALKGVKGTLTRPIFLGGEKDLEKATKANVRHYVSLLQKEIGSGVKVVGGYYFLKSGRVEFLNDDT